MRVRFFFDPACPWTWVTSRWLKTMSDLEDVEIEWRSFSLPYEHRDDEMSAQQEAAQHADVAAHRIIEFLRRNGDNNGVSRFYDALGRRWHQEEMDRTVAAVRDAAQEAGLDASARAVDDASLDLGVAASTEEAMALAGPDIGSPVLQLEDGRSLFGPILHAVPDETGASRVWEAVLLLAEVPEYHELKRGRRQRPDTREPARRAG